MIAVVSGTRLVVECLSWLVAVAAILLLNSAAAASERRAEELEDVLRQALGEIRARNEADEWPHYDPLVVLLESTLGDEQ